jgi:hypothetical protein
MVSNFQFGQLNVFLAAVEWYDVLSVFYDFPTPLFSR